MKITSNVKEIQKAKPITIEEKLHLNTQIDNRIKKVQPQFDLHNQNTGLSQQDLENAVEQSNRLIFKDDNRFEFKIHERTGRMMVKLVDNETDEVIKEIPPEKILDLVASIWDLVGILVDERG